MRAVRSFSESAMKLLLLAASFGLALSAFGTSEQVESARNPVGLTSAPSFSFPLTPEILAREIGSRMHRTQEFDALRRWGMKHRIRMWAAGGTATGLAIYVKQDLENEWLASTGKPLKYFESRFGYNYFDVYRSTQDADIVIDGKEEDALRLEAYLKENFNYLEGSKSVWEVRLLHRSRGSGAAEKDPLLGFDFLNQNSDSYSTGMIEITDPPAGESRIRDLFDWNNRKITPFHHDLVKGELTFSRNPRHQETKRARNEMNPEILSAIRALTKAFQYEARIRPGDEKKILSIVQSWNPSDPVSSYIAGQISKNGQKLFWHSPDVERAWDDTERLGLRTKLIEFGRTQGKTELATWLNREPLRSRPLGTTGKTARELGVTVVSHETNSFLAYENILRSLQGKPNVFISRNNHPGESAAHGEGFYTRPGRAGARGTGLTVRFQMNPDSRVGTDFLHLGDQVVVLNANAFRILEESLVLEPVDLLDLILRHQFSSDDRGLLERFRLRNRAAGVNGREDEYRLIQDLLDATIKNESRKTFELMVKYLITQPKDSPSPLVDACIRHFDQLSRDDPGRLISDVLSIPRILELPIALTWVNRALQGATSDEIKQMLTVTAVALHPEFETWVTQALESDPEYVSQHVLPMEHIGNHKNFVTWVDRAMELSLKASIQGVLKNSKLVSFSHYERWIEFALQRQPEMVFRNLLSQSWLAAHPRYTEWVDRTLERHPDIVIRHVLNSKELMNHPRFDAWVENAIVKNVDLVSWLVLGREHLHTHPKIADWILKAISRHPGALHRKDLFDYTIHELIRKGRGEAFLHLCPVGKITAPRLRRILMDRPTGWDRCALLLRPLMKAFR